MNKKLVSLITTGAIIIGGAGYFIEYKYVPKARAERIEKYAHEMLGLDSKCVRDAYPFDSDGDGVDDKIRVIGVDRINNTDFLMPD